MVRSRRETPSEARARRASVDDPAVVLDAAARFIEVRPRSVDEVRRRLRDAGYQAEHVDVAIERMLALGYLDDAAFARTWVESRDRARPRGARALRDELRRKGVSAEAVEAAIAAREATATGGDADDAGDSDPGFGHGERADSRIADEEAAARLLARRGRAVLGEPDPRRRRARAYALLARNGFDPDVCRDAVLAWLADNADAADGE